MNWVLHLKENPPEVIHTNLGIALKILATRYQYPQFEIVITRAGGRTSKMEFTIRQSNMIIGVIYNELGLLAKKEQEYTAIINDIHKVVNVYSNTEIVNEGVIWHNKKLLAQIEIHPIVFNKKLGLQYWEVIVRDHGTYQNMQDVIELLHSLLKKAKNIS